MTRLPQRVVYFNRIHEVIGLDVIQERFKFLLCDPEGNYIEADYTQCKALAGDRKISFTNPAPGDETLIKAIRRGGTLYEDPNARPDTGISSKGGPFR